MAKNISKRDYRCHAHTNPFRDSQLGVPQSPSDVDWTKHFENGEEPTFLDIGCGYGKFLMETAQKYPTENVLGIEIRDKVYEYVRQKSEAIGNCGIIKSNALLFLPNYFRPNSLKKIFVLFPDPHFKKRKQKGRIICKQMMQVLKYLLRDDGDLYVSTDVKELYQDMCKTITESKCFSEKKEIEQDELLEMCHKSTDEANRAGIKSGHTFGKVFRVIK